MFGLADSSAAAKQVTILSLIIGLWGVQAAAAAADDGEEKPAAEAEGPSGAASTQQDDHGLMGSGCTPTHPDQVQGDLRERPLEWS